MIQTGEIGLLVGCSINHGSCKADAGIDDPEIYDGAPAAVQILGRRFEEEKILSIAQLVVDAVNLSSGHERLHDTKS